MSADRKILLREHGRPARDVKTITGGTPVLPVKSTCPRLPTPDPRLLGAALPFVLILVALNVIVIVAMLAYATTEYQASRNSVQAESARALAQSGIDLAAGIISANSTNNAFVTYQRVPQDDDNKYRLETKIGNVVAGDSTQPWKTKVTNPVVLHSGFTTNTNGFDLNYAADSSGQAGYIAPRVDTNGWTNMSTNMFLMDWIYVFKNNANGSSNVVGRIAYWVDDESSKLNVNYSGTKYQYNTNNFNAPGKSVSINFQGEAGWNQQLNGSIWPLNTELGGISGLSRSNAYSVITNRGECWSTNYFRPYPSVLGVRLGTINGLGGLAVTNLVQQSSLGFTATIYSREEERSYGKGLLRYNLATNLVRGASSNQIPNLVATIASNNPEFTNKYNIPAFANSAFIFGQWASNTNIYGNSPLFVRGMPVINEVSIEAKAWNENGTNHLAVNAGVEIVLLYQTQVNLTNTNTVIKTDAVVWGQELGPPARDQLKASLEFAQSPSPVFFGTSLPQTNIFTYSDAGSKWFQPYSSPNGYTFYGPGPTSNVSNGVAWMSRLLATTNTTNALGALTSPTNIVIRMEYLGWTYQSNTLSLPLTNLPAPALNQTNIYHFVAQPRGDAGYRGDPRFVNNFVVYDSAVTNTNTSGLYTSLGQQNTLNVKTGASAGANWRLDDYASDANSPDIVYSDLLSQDRGLPNITGDPYWESGFASRLVGVGWVGEVPVTTASGDPGLCAAALDCAADLCWLSAGEHRSPAVSSHLPGGG